MEALFNLAFYTAGVGLLSSRIVYVLLHPSPGFLNPLVFFLFPYFPGLSLTGGVTGAILFVIFYKRRKYPTGRIIDFFSMAFLGALPFGYFGSQLLTGMQDKFIGIFMPLIFFVTLIFFIKVLFPFYTRGEIKDGSLGLVFLLIFSFTTLLAKGVHTTTEFSGLLQLDVILLLLIFFGALGFLVKREWRTT